ncbi:hypothetical protein TeGR_g10622, partial [Tetraparma gracilis]
MPPSPGAPLRTHLLSFSLLTNAGIYHGSVGPAPGSPLYKAAGTSLLLYEEIPIRGPPPVDHALTRYHFLLLLPSGLLPLVSRLSLLPVQTLSVPELRVGSPPPCLSADPRPGAAACYVRRGAALFHVSSPHEDRDVWKLRLGALLSPKPGGKKGDAEAELDAVGKMALSSAERGVAGLLRARYYEKSGDGVQAARWRARAPRGACTFAESALGLALPPLLEPRLTLGSARSPPPADNAALVEFLTETFERLSKQQPASPPQLAMLGAWLTELLLASRAAGSPRSTDAAIGAFLAAHARRFDAAATLQVLAARDAAPHEVCAAAAASGAVGPAVRAALSVAGLPQARRRGAAAAVKILAGARLPQFAQVYYLHARKLLERAPGEAKDALLARYGEGLEPEKVLPALV